MVAEQSTLAARVAAGALHIPRRETGRAPAPEQTSDAPAGKEHVTSRPAARAAHVSDALLEPLLAEARDRHASYHAAGIPFVSLAVLVLLIIIA